MRQRETEHERGRVTERETQNLKQAPGSELSAQSPTRGSNPPTARSWPELKSDASPTEPPRRPCLYFQLRLFLALFLCATTDTKLLVAEEAGVSYFIVNINKLGCVIGVEQTAVKALGRAVLGAVPDRVTAGACWTLSCKQFVLVLFSSLPQF